MAPKLKPSTTVQFGHKFTTANEGKVDEFYDLGKKPLGEGSYGTVMVGTKKDSTKHKVAIKAIDKSKISDKTRFEDEILIQLSLDHPNIVRLYETFKDFKCIYLVMELCTGGELFDRILEESERKEGGGEGSGFSEKDAATYMRQIMRAITYLHANNFVHRDIKPENFLLQSKDREAEIKVIDFGLAKRFNPSCDPKMKTKAGTPYYVAPEVLDGKYGEECDVWSCGVILYILLCGYPPFYGDRDPDILRRVRRGTFDFPDKDWGHISGENGAKDLIQRMLTKKVDDRLSASDCLGHPWFKVIEAVESNLTANFGDRLRNFRAVGRIKKLALTLIATRLPPKEIKELKEIFSQLDTNNDGTLTVEEITQAMAKKSLEVPPDLKEVIEKLDTDGSGSIDYAEFIAATMTHQQYTKDGVLWGAFRVFDKDGNGVISQSELQSVLAESNVSQDVAKAMIEEVDINGDGEISFDEFKKMMEMQEKGP